MENSPELNGNYLGTITKDFVKISDILSEASYQVRQRKISTCPIFIFYKKGEISLGELLILKDEKELDWHVNASFLEEFELKEIISEEKAALFKSNYKDPDEFCCLFVIDDSFTHFVYVPYPND